jgi:hypothetical protein
MICIAGGQRPIMRCHINLLSLETHPKIKYKSDVKPKLRPFDPHLFDGLQIR